MAQTQKAAGVTVWAVDSALVHPSLVAWVSGVGARLGLHVTVSSGVRLEAEQREIYSWGRTKQNPHMPATADKPLGPTGTNAMTARLTAHGLKEDGYAHAVDVDVKPWSTSNYAALGADAEAHGHSWGGRFLVDGKPDVRHVETKDWRSLKPASAEQENNARAAGGAVALLAVVLLVGGALWL